MAYFGYYYRKKIWLVYWYIGSSSNAYDKHTMIFNELINFIVEKKGYCFNLTKNFTCICPPQYLGRFCERSASGNENWFVNWFSQGWVFSRNF